MRPSRLLAIFALSASLASVLVACGRPTEGTCEESNDCASGDDDDASVDGGGPGSGRDATSDGNGGSSSPDGEAGPSQGVNEAGDVEAGPIEPTEGGDEAGDGGEGGGLEDQEAGPVCPGEKECNGHCVALDDPAYGCTASSCTPCALTNATPTCANGACAVATCNSGYAHCSGSTPGCETSITTTNDCGNCTTACPGGDVCAENDAGTLGCSLQCPAKQTNCSGACADLTSNDQHCGLCATACNDSPLHGAQHCVSSTCQQSCPNAPYTTLCTASNSCVDTKTDNGNCGTCGHACNDIPSGGGADKCTNGTCVQSCPTSPVTIKLCHDACVDTATSNTDCGACNAPCTKPTNASSAQCTNSACAIVCNPGYHLCNNNTACLPDTDLPTQDPCVITEQFGYFVSASLGNDSNAGTRAAPFKSINAGQAAAAKNGRRVYVCAETYASTPADLASNVWLFGYFSCGGGVWTVGTNRASISGPTSPLWLAQNATNVRVEGFVVQPVDMAPGSAVGTTVFTAYESTVALVNVDLIGAAAGSGQNAGNHGAGQPDPQAQCTTASDGAAAAPGANGAPKAGTWSIGGGFTPGDGGDGVLGASGHNGTLAAPGCVGGGTGCSKSGTKCSRTGTASSCGGPAAPGCGGPASPFGKGGGGGASSVALIINNSTVTVTGGKLWSGAGGAGGSGVAGLPPSTTWKFMNGTVGTDGPGIITDCTFNSQDGTCDQSIDNGSGGSGGTGGLGAKSGDGAGGSGGDSYAYMTFGASTVTVDSSTSVKAGAAGAAGGGPIPGFAGHSAVHN